MPPAPEIPDCPGCDAARSLEPIQGRPGWFECWCCTWVVQMIPAIDACYGGGMTLARSSVGAGLQAGDEVCCAHCGQWHVASYNTNADAIRVTSVQEMLYAFCPKKAARFYVGSVGKPTRWPMRKANE